MAAIETPCIRICAVHPALKVCVGCGRTLDEIGRWIAMTDAERSRVMAQLPQRRAKMTVATATSADLRA
jgi:predicted Fe-S protein YdhL (DUF1289 family)